MMTKQMEEETEKKTLNDCSMAGMIGARTLA
jgi:hypothetical protein